jgi:serine phosphatase RsbU (regulator of sigma subunit)
MKTHGIGLRGKFVVALLVAVALPFLVGLVVFQSAGYRHLLDERGKLHRMQAHSLARALDLAARGQGENLRTHLAADPALASHIADENLRLSPRPPEVTAAETANLESLWNTLPDADPRLRAILDNPGSASLRRYQADHPACAEILATDSRGRLVAATGKATDYDQADEDWWSHGVNLEADGQFAEQLRFDASSDSFSIDVVLPLHEAGKVAGIVKMSVDVTSLFSRIGFDVESQGQRWDIVLPDGRILASSSGGTTPPALPATTMEAIRAKGSGWETIGGVGDEARLAGFVAMGMGQPRRPNAYILFSSRHDEVVGPLRAGFVRIGIAAATLLGLCALAGFVLIRHKILRPLAVLGNAARSIADTARLHPSPVANHPGLGEQHLKAEAELLRIREIRTGDEVEALAADLDVMTSRVLRYQRELEAEVAAKTSAIRADLELAREFQNALMPTRYPEPDRAADTPLRLRCAHFYQPAATLGGDFFDILELEPHRTGILIADVMGHGARSALVTAILRALVRHHSQSATSPGVFLTEINRHLREVVERGGQTFFVTAFLLVLDTRASTASWAVAGHPAPLKVRRGAGREPEPLWRESRHQPALGLIAASSYLTVESPLRAGDVFLLHTDGAVEAENPSGQPFGLQRLIRSFDDALDGPMAAMPAKIFCDVTAWRKLSHCDDDVCLVTVEAVVNRQDKELKVESS